MRPLWTTVPLALLVLAGAGCAQGPRGMGPGGMGPGGMESGMRGGGPRMGHDDMPGGPMMSEAERDEFHRRMQAARTPEECRQVMDEHRRRMQERAAARGMTMPGPPYEMCERMQRGRERP